MSFRRLVSSSLLKMVLVDHGSDSEAMFAEWLELCGCSVRWASFTGCSSLQGGHRHAKNAGSGSDVKEMREHHASDVHVTRSKTPIANDQKKEIDLFSRAQTVQSAKQEKIQKVRPSTEFDPIRCWSKITVVIFHEIKMNNLIVWKNNETTWRWNSILGAFLEASFIDLTLLTEKIQVVAEDWIFSSRIKFVGLEPILGPH